MKNIIKILAVIVLIPFVIYFWPATLGGDTTIMIVQGNSMLPTIIPGSLVVAKTAPEYYVDDIVAYESDFGGAKKIVVHRIIEERPNGFVIKGDNNPKKDVGFPTEDAILGAVLFSTPYVGDALGMLRNPILLVFAAGAVFGIQTVQKTRKDRKEKMRYIRLGIPRPSKKNKDIQKTPKKPDYSMFAGAIIFNVITYVALVILIENDITPQGDSVTGFLYNGIIPHLASILITTFYFGIIFGLFILARKYQKKIDKRLAVAAYYGQSISLLKKKQYNPMLTVASVGWLLFILLSIFHLMAIGTDLAPIIS